MGDGGRSGVPSSGCSDMRIDLELVRSISSPSRAVSIKSSPSGIEGVDVSSRLKLTHMSLVGLEGTGKVPITPMSAEGPSPQNMMNLAGDQFRRTTESGPGGRKEPKGGHGSRSSTSTADLDFESYEDMKCVEDRFSEVVGSNRLEDASGVEYTV